MTELCRLHPVRCSRTEKQAFLNDALPELESLGFSCSVLHESSLGLLSEDLIAGNPEGARVIVTAHYDTPRLPLIPLRTYPTGSIRSLLFILPYILLPLLIAVAVSRMTGGGAYTGGALFVLLMIAFIGVVPARSSRDTSDSGIEALFICAEKLPPGLRPRVAFVLTDNRHTFGLGASLLQREFSPDRSVVISIEGVGAEPNLAVLSRDTRLASDIAGENAVYGKGAFRIPRTDERAFCRGVLITAVNERGARICGRNENDTKEEQIEHASQLVLDYIERGF